jgi:hypothetical protein
MGIEGVARSKPVTSSKSESYQYMVYKTKELHNSNGKVSIGLSIPGICIVVTYNLDPLSKLEITFFRSYNTSLMIVPWLDNIMSHTNVS